MAGRDYIFDIFLVHMLLCRAPGYIAIALSIRVLPLIEINSSAHVSFIQILHVSSIETIWQNNLLSAFLSSWLTSLLSLDTLLGVILGIIFLSSAASVVVNVLMELLGPFFLVP